MIFFLLSTVRSSKDAPRIEYEHIFTSPWCCDASEESQYRAMMESLTSLNMDEGECTLFLLAAMFDTSGKSVCLFVYLCEWTPSWRKESGYPINKTSADGNAQGSLSGLILSHITIEKITTCNSV